MPIIDSISDFVNFPATDSTTQPNSEEPLLSARNIHYGQDAPDINHDESKLQPQNPSGVGIGDTDGGYNLFQSPASLDECLKSSSKPSSRATISTPESNAYSGKQLKNCTTRPPSGDPEFPPASHSNNDDPRTDITYMDSSCASDSSMDDMPTQAVPCIKIITRLLLGNEGINVDAKALARKLLFQSTNDTMVVAVPKSTRRRKFMTRSRPLPMSIPKPSELRACLHQGGSEQPTTAASDPVRPSSQYRPNLSRAAA